MISPDGRGGGSNTCYIERAREEERECVSERVRERERGKINSCSGGCLLKCLSVSVCLSGWLAVWLFCIGCLIFDGDAQTCMWHRHLSGDHDNDPVSRMECLSACLCVFLFCFIISCFMEGRGGGEGGRGREMFASLYVPAKSRYRWYASRFLSSTRQRYLTCLNEHTIT